MKISIHMPAYNAEATIASALKSLLRQRDAGQLDIIVVDDGSTDRTCDIVRDMAATAPEIRLIRIAHGGISRARNAALRAMAQDTDLVGFLDADDLSPEGRYAHAVGILEADPSLQLILSKIRFFDREDTEKLAPSANSNATDGRMVHLAATVFRRKLLDGVAPFDETLSQSEDLDFLLRIFEQRPKYVQSDRVGVFYRKNHGGITENRRQVRQELMKAVFRARKRQAHSGPLMLPEGLISMDHVPELLTWMK
jgi:glycosyltransferase involved in cell wall biosynthesis